MNHLIDIHQKYGLDGQYIHFNPDIEGLVAGDIITQGNFKLVCVKRNEFVIFTNRPHEFIPGYLLLKEWKKAI